MALDDDLIAYYEAEARGGHRRGHGQLRHDLRHRFRSLLHTEQRSTLVDVGAGPGLDTCAWHDDGFSVVGIDLAHGNTRRIADHSTAAVTASLYELPFPNDQFDALWTMSTFVHVPRDRFDDAIGEMLRVAAPGAPLAIGTWGGRDFEGIVEFGELRPFRFFSLSSHDRWQHLLERHGDLEVFETFDPHDTAGWEYQFAVLRAPA